MRQENLKEAIYGNLVAWHSLGYTGKGIKIASPEDLVSMNCNDGHGYYTAQVTKQSAPDRILFDVDYDNKWASNFPKFIDDCIANKVDIIMNALMFSLDDVKKTAIKKAMDAGIIFVNAAGNENTVREIQDNDRNTDVRSYTPFVQIAALQLYQDKKIERVNYSNKGVMLDYAEFTDIWTEEGHKFTGTSCATPYFAGKLACLLQWMKERKVPVSKWQEIVDGNLLDLGTTGRDDLYGKGLFVLPDITKLNEQYPKGYDTIIKIQTGNTNVDINGEILVLDQAPIVDPITNRTLLPLRGILEALGYKVDWDQKTQTTTITK